MKKGRISQSLFNEICEKLRSADQLPWDTDAHELVRDSFPELRDGADEDTVSIAEKVFKAAVGIAELRKDPADEMSDVTDFMFYFERLWDLVIPDPQAGREEYLRTLQPYQEKGILTEDLWTEDYSVLRLDNGVYGLFNYEKKSDAFRGIPLSGGTAIRVMERYLKHEEDLRKARILDQAQMMKYINVYEAADAQGFILDQVRDPDGGQTIIFYVPKPEMAQPRSYNVENIVSKYSNITYEGFLKTLIFYNMKLDERSAEMTYLTFKNLFTELNDQRCIYLSGNAIVLNLPKRPSFRIRELADLEPVGILRDENKEKYLLRMNEEYHRSEWEQEDRIRERAEKAARIEAYWTAHPEEKEALDREENAIREDIAGLSGRMEEYYRKKRSIDNTSVDDLASEVKEVSDEIARLMDSVHSVSFFDKKKRKAIQEEIDQLKEKRRGLEIRLKAEESSLAGKKERDRQALETEFQPVLNRKEELEKRLSEIEAEKQKDRL